MKNKGLKVVCLALFGFTSAYLYKSWETYSDKSNFEMEEFEMTQGQISIKSLKSQFKEPVWFVKSDSPMVYIKMKFKNEGDRSFVSQPEILSVLNGTILEGAGTRDGIALKKILNENSINISVSSDSDNAIVSISCLAKYFDLTTDLVCDILGKAHFKKEKIEITKQGLTVSLQQSKFTPRTLANEKLNNMIYPKNHPYRISYDNILKVLPTYTKEDIDSCYKKLFVPMDAVITAGGNIDEKHLISGLDKIYKSLSHKSNDFKPVIQKTEINEVGKVAHIELDNPQSSVVFALPGVLKNDPERFAVRLANIAFGISGFNSRLVKNVRDDNGLVYRISSFINDSDLSSYIRGVADTRPENVSKVIEKIKSECQKFYEKGISKEELKLFKTYIFAGHVLGTTAETLAFIDSCREDGIALENVSNYLNNYFSLTLSDVNNAIKKVFDPKKLIFVDCGKLVQKKEKKNEKVK